MHIGSGLNTVSSLYGQQKGNQMKAPASAEKTFYTAETPKVYQIFTTDNMLWTGGNGTGLSYCLKYADDSTDENPVVLAKGVDENGKEFEQRIYINDVNPSNATESKCVHWRHITKWKSREVLRLCRLKLVIWDLTTEEILSQCSKKA